MFLLCSLNDDVACRYDFSEKTSSFLLIPLFNRLQKTLNVGVSTTVTIHSRYTPSTSPSLIDSINGFQIQQKCSICCLVYHIIFCRGSIDLIKPAAIKSSNVSQHCLPRAKYHVQPHSDMQVMTPAHTDPETRGLARS